MKQAATTRQQYTSVQDTKGTKETKRAILRSENTVEIEHDYHDTVQSAVQQYHLVAKNWVSRHLQWDVFTQEDIIYPWAGFTFSIFSALVWAAVERSPWCKVRQHQPLQQRRLPRKRASSCMYHKRLL